MAVDVFYRQVYRCDTEAERSLSWPAYCLIYTSDTNKWWKILGGAFVEVQLSNVSAPTSGGGGAAWGEITGTLSNQLDLNTVLTGKAAADHNHNGTYEPANANIQSHIGSAHAPADAQKNSDITKAEIEAKLTGEITSHTHPSSPGGEAFPVGSVFISVVSTNPSTLLGYGTWVAFGAGKMLIGLDAGDADFDTEEETGGAKTKTLSVAEMPSHTHIQDPHSHIENSNNATTGPLRGWGAADTSTNTSMATGYSTADATAVNQNTGGDQAFSLMNPYIVVRFWKRTA